MVTNSKNLVINFNYNMNPINYIKHLNGVFQQFSKDSRLNPTHISLYMSLKKMF